MPRTGRRRPGTPGRIFVGNGLPFEGYTGGGTKEIVDGMMASGDVGHFDSAGRLFIDGRDDEMIVSGGENVFPGEVEDALDEHPGIAEAAVIGVDDPEFGQRLRSFVVTRPGASLDRRRRQRICRRTARALQGAARRGVRRQPAAQPQRQGAQAAT